MEVDSAIWYIEAASNYTYANAGTDYEESIIDSAKIVVPLTNGKVLISAVQLAYDQVIDSLSSHNAAIPESEKQLIVADIALTEADDNTVTLEVTSVFGTDRISVCTNDYPWYWGRALGRCDGTGLGVGKDAADIIEQLARCDIAVPAGNAYYTDVVFEWITGCEYQNENGDCLIFENYQEYVLVHPCLSASEISFYKNGLLTVCNLLKPSSQHSIIGFDFYDDEAHGLLPDFGDYWVLVHKADIEYGIWHSSGEPPAEL
jgi:hypothetical protein